MRARPADLLAGAASLALLLSTFLGWYAPRGRDETLNAWEAFAIADLLLGAVVALGLALAVAQVAGRGPTLPVGLVVITATAAIAAELVVLYRLIDQPGPNDLIEVARAPGSASPPWSRRPPAPGSRSPTSARGRRTRPPLAVERRPAPPRS